MGLFGPPNVEKMRAKRDVKGLIKALQYRKDNDVCRAAAEALGQIGATQAVELLIVALKDGDSDMSKAAAGALGQIGATQAVEPLIAVLKDGDSDVRKTAADALGKIGDGRAVEPLIAVLKDGDTDVRKGVTDALAKIGAPAVEPLIAALKISDSNIPLAAAGVLERIGWRPDQDESGAAYWAAKQEWSKCLEIGAPAVEPLIAALKDRNIDVSRAAADALRQIGDARAIDRLINALEDKDSDRFVRKVAADALARIGVRAVDPLIVALKDKHSEVRWAAAGALGKIGDARAVEPLIATLTDGNKEVRLAAGFALGQIGDARAVEPLIAALPVPAAEELITEIMWSRDSNVQRAAARALGKIGDVRAIEPLIASLKAPAKGLLPKLEDYYSDACQGAADALVEIGASAVEPLSAALQHNDRSVCRAAAGVLERIGWRPGQDESGAAYWVVERKWDKCIEIGAPAVAPLIAALKDVDVRWPAARVLGKIGDARAVEPLIAALKDVHEDAAEALVKIGAPAVEPLIAALQHSDSRVRWAAAGVLGKIGDARAVEPLIAALRDVHKAAAEALVNIGTPAVAPLIAALQHSDSRVRWAAAGVLKSISWQDESGAAYWVFKGEWGRCIEIGAPAVAPLIASLTDPGVRKEAADALARIGAPAVAPLIAALKISDSNMRSAAANALARIGALAVEPLIAALKISDSNMRWAAAGVLGKIKEAADALARIGAPVVEPPIAALKISDSNMRSAAAGVLGKIGDARAVEPLIAALRDVHEAAAEALVNIGAPAVAPLIAALQHSNSRVRWAAAGVLKSIGWRPGQDESGAAYWVLKGEWGRCIEIGAPAVAPLIAALTDPGVRKEAADALARIGAPAVAPLIAALKISDSNMRSAAAGVLERIGWRPDKDES